MNVNGIDGGSNPKFPSEDHPENAKEDRPARISDVPYIGDGFHSGGSRAYANKPDILKERLDAWRQVADGPGLVRLVYGWAKTNVTQTRLWLFIAAIVEKIKGSNDKGSPPAAPSGESGGGSVPPSLPPPPKGANPHQAEISGFWRLHRIAAFCRSLAPEYQPALPPYFPAHIQSASLFIPPAVTPQFFFMNAVL